MEREVEKLDTKQQVESVVYADSSDELDWEPWSDEQEPWSGQLSSTTASTSYFQFSEERIENNERAFNGRSFNLFNK